MRSEEVFVYPASAPTPWIYPHYLRRDEQQVAREQPPARLAQVARRRRDVDRDADQRQYRRRVVVVRLGRVVDGRVVVVRVALVAHVDPRERLAGIGDRARSAGGVRCLGLKQRTSS